MKGNEYHTYDLTLAAYLIAGGLCALTDIQSSGNGRKRFVFDPAPRKEDLIRFYSGEAEVSARRFAEAWATLKGTGYTMKEFA